MSSRPKRSCATCGKTGKLFKETKTDTIVCSIECARQALVNMEIQSQNRPTATTVHISSKIGLVLGDLHDLIGSERFGMLMKKGEAYDWTKSTRHDVPVFLHGPLEKHIGPEQDGGGTKRSKSEQESTDGPKLDEEKPEGGEEKKVARREDGVILTTQGTVAKSYSELLPLDVWKQVIIKGGWDSLFAMMNPFGNQWALEDPVGFFQMLLDFSVYELDNFEDNIIKMARLSENRRVATMFILQIEQIKISRITQDSKESYPYLFSDYIFQQFDSNYNRKILKYFPDVYSFYAGDQKIIDIVISAGLCLRYGPMIWPIFANLGRLEGGNDVLVKITRKMLESRSRFITPASVGLAVFANSKLFDLVLDSAKRQRVPLIGVLKALDDEMLRIDSYGKTEEYRIIDNIIRQTDSNLRDASKDWKDLVLDNLAKLPDYGGGVQAIDFLKRFFGSDMVAKYLTADFPELDLEGSIASYLISQIRDPNRDYNNIMRSYQRLTATNKTVENMTTVELLGHYYSTITTGVSPFTADEVQKFTDALLPHVRDADILLTLRWFSGLFYDPLTRVGRFPSILKQVARVPSFTLTSTVTFVGNGFLQDPNISLDIIKIFETRCPKRSVSNLEFIKTPVTNVLDQTEFDHRFLLDASWTDLGRVFYADTKSTLFTTTQHEYPALRTHLRYIALPPDREYRVVAPEWIMERCNIAENDNLLCALIALSYSENHQKRLCELAAQKMAPEQILLSSEQIVYGPEYIYTIPAFDMFFYSVENTKGEMIDMYTKVQDMFVYLVDLMYQRHGTDFDLLPSITKTRINENHKIPNIYLDLARVIKERTKSASLYDWLFQFGHQEHVLEVALKGSEYQSVSSMLSMITRLMPYRAYKKKSAILAILKKMIESFPNADILRELSDGVFLKQTVNRRYEDGDIAEDLMALLAPIFPMDFKFDNESTFLHWFAHYLDPLQLIKKYKEATKKTPNLFSLNSDGVSVIGVFFWHQKNPYDALRKLAAKYKQYDDYRYPHVLLGMDVMLYRMRYLGIDEMPAKIMKLEAQEKVVHLLGNDPTDVMLNARRPGSANEAWWSCKMGRTIAKFLSTRYPRLNFGAYVDGDGDNALLSYFLNRKTTTTTVSLQQVEQLLKAGVSVSQLGGNQIVSPIHHFVDFFQQTKTTKAILKRLIQDVSFDRTIKPTQGQFKDMTAKEVSALAKKFDFVVIFEKQGITNPSIAAAASFKM